MHGNANETQDCKQKYISFPEYRVLLCPPLYMMSPRGLADSPPPCSRVVVSFLHLLLAKNKKSRKRVTKAEIPLDNSNQG